LIGDLNERPLVSTITGKLNSMTKKLLVILTMTMPRLAMAQRTPDESASGLPAQAALVDGVLVPVPSEIFGSLDRFAGLNWKQVQRLELARSRPAGEQAQTALRLGAVIAEGFIAVEAQDVAEIKEIGQTVLTLALALGVEKSVLRRSESIIDYADKGQWAAVRQEWSAVNADVKEAMLKRQSEQVSELVSFGGWLRGTEALTVLVLQHYAPAGSILLHQPAVLDYFELRLGRMSGKLKENSIVAQSGKIISTVRQLSTPRDEARISAANVGEIRATVAGVVDTIQAEHR
jgi:hypothetical protein